MVAADFFIHSGNCVMKETLCSETLFEKKKKTGLCALLRKKTFAVFGTSVSLFSPVKRCG